MISLASDTDQRVIVLDTETTGLDPVRGDRVIEIACLELEKGLYPTGRVMHYYFNPGEQSVSHGAFSVHGISTEFLQDKPNFSDLASEIWEFLSGATLVIHNASFDMKFLNAEFGLLDYPAISMEQTVCTLKIARKKFPGAANNLDALCKRFNISLQDRDKHGALVDVRLLAAVYVELTQGGRQQTLISNGQNNVEDINQRLVIQRKQCPKRAFDVGVEIEAHKAFILNALKINSWGY